MNEEMQIAQAIDEATISLNASNSLLKREVEDLKKLIRWMWKNSKGFSFAGREDQRPIISAIETIVKDK